MTALVLSVKAIRLFERPVALRLPFKFGSAAVTQTAQAFAEVTVEDAAGNRAAGASAQLMVPRWFNKAPALSNEDTVDELRASVRAAAAALEAAGSDTVAGLSASCRGEAVAVLAQAGTPRLAAGFGPALLEMALIDAACRLAGLPFDRALNTDAFGLTAHCPADLDRAFLTQRLRSARLPERMFIRHTIGQDAPLFEADLGPDAPRDGLPVALETVITRQGLRTFKIKLNGDVEADAARLVRLSDFLARRCPGFRATLDANEQYGVGNFAGFAERLARDAALRPIAHATLFVEQPFARDAALSDPDIPALLSRIATPVLIDESDDDDGVFPRALALGYAGTSVKSCKGVLRAVVNAARADQQRAAGRPAMISAEDLTCQPGLAVQQDLAMAGVCGATHAERNGHHFVAGMQDAEPHEAAAYLDRHGDLYRRLGEADATLNIIDGAVTLGSLAVPGFATAVRPDFSHANTFAVQEDRQ